MSKEILVFSWGSQAGLCSQLLSKQRQITTQYDVGSETGNRLWPDPFHEVPEQDLERQLSLGKRPLT